MGKDLKMQLCTVIALLSFFGCLASAFTMAPSSRTKQLTVAYFPSRKVASFAPLFSQSNEASMDESSDVIDGGKASEETLQKRKWRKRSVVKLPKIAYKIYTSYAKRLWKETDVSARKKIANDKVRGAIRQLEQLLSDEYMEYSESSNKSKSSLLAACDDMLLSLPSSSKPLTNKSPAPDSKKPKKQRSVLFGALMGAAVACWVFSGNYVFTGLFTLMTILGQLEYYRMVINTGVYPARRISVIGAASMFLTVRYTLMCKKEQHSGLYLILQGQALFAPNLHQICLPLFGLWAMIWFLATRRSYSTIPEIASTFTGMFYLGYVPSFWVRLRLIGENMTPTRLHTILGPLREYLNKIFGVYIPDGLVYLPITSGAVFIFWSWLSLAFSDVGAYFVGRKFGKTKLGAISPAAGATSPNKTVEGVIGGCVTSAVLSIMGAWVQKWPYFVITGGLHGIILGILGLVGDLTASMLKRDAKIKDFGDLIPEHGGILDRVDSFVWSAPYSWLAAEYILPAVKTMAGA